MKSYFNNEEYIYVKSFLRTNPSEALIRTEEYIKKYPNDYIAGVFYSKVLKVLGSFSEALYVLGNIEERYTSNKKLFNDFAKYNIIEEKVLYNKLRCLSYLEDFDKVFYEVKKKILFCKAYYFGTYEDVYIFKYDKCGVTNGKVSDYFLVITFHNTNKYISMYPCNSSSNFNYVDLNYLKIPSTSNVKRLSQIDKFNMRYKK